MVLLFANHPNVAATQMLIATGFPAPQADGEAVMAFI